MKSEEKFIDFIVFVLKTAKEKRQYRFIDEVLKFIDNKAFGTDLAIKIFEGLLKEFKKGKINQWASEKLEVFQEIKQIEEREESKKKFKLTRKETKNCLFFIFFYYFLILYFLGDKLLDRGFCLIII